MATKRPLGHIKLYRKMLDSPVMVEGSGDLLKVWLYCLLKSNLKKTTWSPKRNTWNQTIKVNLEAGQFCCGRMLSSQFLKIPSSTFRNCLEKLRQMDMIHLEPEALYSKITIKNWKHYQLDEPKEKTTPSDEKFKEFLDLWPSEGIVNSKKTKEEFNKIFKKEPNIFPEILKAVIVQTKTRHWKKEDPEFCGYNYIPRPHNWLKNRSFEENYGTFSETSNQRNWDF